MKRDFCSFHGMKFVIAFFVFLTLGSEARALFCSQTADISKVFEFYSDQLDVIEKRVEAASHSNAKTCKVYRNEKIPLYARAIKEIKKLYGCPETDPTVKKILSEFRIVKDHSENYAAEKCKAAGM